MSVCLLVGSNSAHLARKIIALRMARAYAAKHGYAVIDVTMSDVDFRMVEKFDSIRKALTEYDVVVWLDSDCCVVDNAVRVEEIIRLWGTPLTEIFTAIDWNGPCCCVYIIKSKPWSREFFRMAASISTDKSFKCDQAVYRLLQGHFAHRCHRYTTLPTTVVADQTVQPIPVPWVWHLSMREETERMMLDVERAVERDVFLEYAYNWVGFPHGVRYE